jgi:hypothetical protein
MPTPKESPDTFASIDREALADVAGGASSDAQLTATLSSITSSIADLSRNQNQSDPMQMMLLVMMMGGFGGGGGGGVIAAPAAAGPPVINVDTSVAGRGGWGPGFAFGGGGGPCFGPRKCGKKGW